MRVADFFCGGGGFSEGFRQAGFEIVFAVDKWEPAVNTYRGNKPGVNVIQDDVIRISKLPEDEFEALVPNRSKINNSSESGEVNEFLSQMNNCGKDRIFVIASSNRPDLIDPAILRKGRMDKVIFIPVPDKEARQGIFEIHMKDRPASDDIDFARLADMTENFVASDIAYIVNDAATRAFEDDVEITQALLEEVIKENNPSVSPNDLKSYEAMRKKMEASGVEPERRRIGFV